MLVENQNKNNSELNAWSLYLFALKSPVTREKYQTRLDKFFKFIGLDGKQSKTKVLILLLYQKRKEVNGSLIQY